mgnify:CR=1 FL=1|jgi:hypothetical protein
MSTHKPAAWRTDAASVQGGAGTVRRPQVTPATPLSQPIRQALDSCEPLTRLTQRLRESTERLDAIRPLLPPPMRAAVRSGPLDAEGWTILADNGAVAAKLRHMVPALQQRMESAGWPAMAIRVKVLSGT